jgi:hypothetical protein
MKIYASMVLGGEARNVEQLGAYVAWLINNRLFGPNVERESGRSVTRVRMQDFTGADFLATELHGELKSDQLTGPGRSFTEHYLLSNMYDQDYLQVDFTGENEWLRYADLAPLISKAYRNFNEPARRSLTGSIAKILKFPSFKSRSKS